MSAGRTLGASTLLALLTAVSTAHAEPLPALNHVRDVRIDDAKAHPGAVELAIATAEAPKYQIRTERDGKRLVIELPQTDITDAPRAIVEGRGVIGGVLTDEFAAQGGKTTRITVNLTKGVTYRARTEHAKLLVTLEGADGDAAGKASKAKEATDEKGSPSALRAVRFEHLAAQKGVSGCLQGCDRIVIDGQGGETPPYGLSSRTGGVMRITIPGYRLPEGSAGAASEKKGGPVVESWKMFYDAAADASVVEVSGTADAAGFVTSEGGRLVWTFGAPSASSGASKTAAGSHRKSVTVAREQKFDEGPAIETSILGRDGTSSGDKPTVETEGTQQAGFASTVSGQFGGTGARYTGRRLDIDFKDADIHNILRLLADVGKVNIITADDVSGSVTIRMRGLPWDQILDVVLQTKGLGMTRQGNLIRVAPAATLNKERELRLAQQKQEFELTPLETRLIPVSYATAEEVQSRAKDLLSPRGSLAVDERTNVIIARDISSNLNHIEELVRSLDTQTPQVLIEARIVEATSRYFHDVGIQWGADATFSEATGNPTGLAFPSRFSTAGASPVGTAPTAGLNPRAETVTNPNFVINLPAAIGAGSGGGIGMSFGSIDNTINLAVRLSAAETTGMVRIVSSPRILTLDNREARINSGTLIPFSQVSAQGVQTTFQEAKLQLLVRPHVTADGSVAMHVKINRDEPDFNQTSARGDPTILKREAETDLLVMDGHTAVIGGIFTRNTGRGISQLPFFGDIPILGVLFQKRNASDTRNELVIFLTPRIVNRAEALGR